MIRFGKKLTFLLLVTVTASLHADYQTDPDGFIPYWLAIGPMPIEEGLAAGKGLKDKALRELALSNPAAGEKVRVGDREYEWKLAAGGGEDLVVDLAEALGNSENVAAVMVAHLDAATEMKTYLNWGSDDSGAVFVNGVEVGRFAGLRGVAHDQERTKRFKLRKGINTVSMIVLNGEGAWKACARLTDKKGKGIRGVELKDAPEGKESFLGKLWAKIWGKRKVSVFVDQIGYRTAGRKVAVVAGNRPVPQDLVVELLEKKGKKVVWTSRDGQNSLRRFRDGGKDFKSGDYVTHVDFSGYQKGGRYFLRASWEEGRVDSYAFNIADDIYYGTALAAWKMFYFNRADCAKPEKYAGPWHHKLTHHGPGQATDAKVYKWTGKAHWDPVGEEVIDEGPYDIRGGWWDAGNFDKYMGNTTKCIFQLLYGVLLVPGGVADGELNIPESGNGTRDSMDEIRWGVEFISRLADDTGAAFGRVYVPSGCPPESVKRPVQLTARTSGATMTRAALLAYAAMVWRELGLDAKFVEECLADATKSLSLLAKNPHPWPPDPEKPGRLLYTGEWYTHRYGTMKALHAAAMFRLTGEKGYDRAVRDWLKKHKPRGLPRWEFRCVAMAYIGAKGAHAGTVKKIKKMALEAGEKVVERSGFNRGYCHEIRGYWWGCNTAIGETGMAAAFAAEFAKKEEDRRRYLDAAEDYAHYLLGRNPLGLCYLSNMKHLGAENSVMVMYHAWVGNENAVKKDPECAKYVGEGKGKIGPPPGFVTGGANGSMKTWVYDLDWRKNPWQFSEPCLPYQSPAVNLFTYLALKGR